MSGIPIYKGLSNSPFELQEGFIKKVQTNQIIMVPNAKSQVRLDELNEIIDKLALGGEAAEKMANIDAQAGLRDPAKSANQVSVSNNSALSDADIAKNMLTQAETMLSEAKRLQDEAYKMDPNLKPKTTTSRAKSTTAKKPAAKKTSNTTKTAAEQ